MIDLSRQDSGSRIQDSGAGNEPLGAVILAVMPFAWLFWALIEWGLR